MESATTRRKTSGEVDRSCQRPFSSDFLLLLSWLTMWGGWCEFLFDFLTATAFLAKNAFLQRLSPQNYLPMSGRCAGARVTVTAADNWGALFIGERRAVPETVIDGDVLTRRQSRTNCAMNFREALIRLVRASQVSPGNASAEWWSSLRTTFGREYGWDDCQNSKNFLITLVCKFHSSFAIS